MRRAGASFRRGDLRTGIAQARRAQEAMRTAMQTTLVAPNGNGKINHEILGEFLDAEASWYCTTCGACLEVCPVTVPGTNHKAIYISDGTQPGCAVIDKDVGELSHAGLPGICLLR